MVPQILVADLLDAWNSHNAARVEECHAPDFEGVDVYRPNAIMRGRAGVGEVLAACWRSFPDLELSFDDVVVDGNRVVVFWTGEGTHAGPLFNIPATGRRVRMNGVSRLRLSEAGVQEALYLWDVAGLLRDLGLLPDP